LVLPLPYLSASAAKTSSLMSAPGATARTAEGSTKQLGRDLKTCCTPLWTTVWPALGAPVLTQSFGESLRARYAVILPLPVSPKNPSTITVIT
jgi:hypothetical protein